MIPDNVEKIIMTKEDYDRNVEQLLLEKTKAEQEIERLRNIIKEAKDFIANNSTISGAFGKKGRMIVESIEEIHNGMRLFEILDKENK